MLLHIIPKLFSTVRDCTIADLTIEPFGLQLRGGVELRTVRPYLNKRYAVAARRIGRKALDGILIETPEPISAYSYTARWAIEAQHLVTHHVTCKLLDRDFDAASEDSVLWYAHSESLGGWISREPDQIAPLQREPVMELEARVDDGERKPGRVDKLTARGLIIERREVFNLPTIEPERLLTGPDHELRPTPAIALRIDGSRRSSNETIRRPRKSAGLIS
jgi:hypothetical protein